ncbi:unnamed protein product [Urochloa decumbens]|uniref:MIF4G domain-containing protein n=1 Tax=Urochloa decumbens TaxID=240449 RepID=A0ABC9FID4_9POAL
MDRAGAEEEGYMSQRGDKGEGHARKPGRSTCFGGHRGRGGPSSQRSSLSSNWSFWRPVNAHGGHQQQVHDASVGFQPEHVPRPPHHGEPSKGFSRQFYSMNLEGIPQFPARTSTANPGLDGHKYNQALSEEHKVAPSTPVQLDLKQQQFPHQPNKFVGRRLKNTVEITHAEAHEELKLDKRMEPSPITPMQIMHKAKKKYVVGKVSHQEEVKLRQLNAILNKVTQQNFLKLSKEVEEINIDNVAILTWFVSNIYCRVLVEPTFCQVYANFCSQLVLSLPGFSEDNESITFMRLLLNICQMEFERSERKEAEADKREEGGAINQTKEEREERRIDARKRMLGNIRFIGELYKKRMLTERIMHECIKKLIGDFQNPDEKNIEGLCTLMSTIGEIIDHRKSKEHMDAYFDIMQKLSISQELPFRVRFLLRDAIDLRKNKWQQRCKLISS